MLKYTEKIEELTLPVVPMRGIVAFPSIPLSFEVSREMSEKACEKANQDNGYLFLLAQKEISNDHPTEKDFFSIGTVARIKQYLKVPENNTRVVAEGFCRADVLNLSYNNGMFTARVLCKTINLENEGGIKGEALVLEALSSLERFLEYLPKQSSELMMIIHSIKSPGLLADFIASNMLIKFTDKQKILNEFDPMKRLEHLILLLEKEMEILKIENTIHSKVKAKVEQNQKEYYLREQLKIIQNELGTPPQNEDDTEIEEYLQRIEKANLPKEVKEKLLKENNKLAKTPFGSAESTVLTNYLDTCLEIPWGKYTADRLDIIETRKILDADHNGLEKIKDRITELLAAKQLNPDLRSPILCLVGPPGTGKTSICRSIAHSMKRKYVRVSLGGIRDEADIRGHRKTYVGAMPGRIVQALIQAKSMNPLLLLDEIDKITSDAHGDPASALLEVLDSEQNVTFRDHFTELPLDLSRCLFIATANTLETIPKPLIDRMEIIEFRTYTRNEKYHIAKKHLIPKQKKLHALNSKLLKIKEDALYAIIDHYTKEAGVRNLERLIGTICRKTAKKIVAGSVKSVTVSLNNLTEFLGTKKILPDRIPEQDEVGIVNGLAYTETGGEMLQIEVAALPGSGKIELTGSLGDVMKESAKTAISYVRSQCAVYNIDPDFYKNRDIHIHAPEGAIPKDGPSAGLALATALVSELTGYPIRRDIAMTGEITLRGHALAIGGLREKTMAAFKAGIKTVLIPHDNIQDLEEIDPVVKETLHFVSCRTASEVLEHALVFPISIDNNRNPAQNNEKNPGKEYLIPNIPSSNSKTTRISLDSSQN